MKNAEDAGVMLTLYERYIDDSYLGIKIEQDENAKEVVETQECS